MSSSIPSIYAIASESLAEPRVRREHCRDAVPGKSANSVRFLVGFASGLITAGTSVLVPHNVQYQVELILDGQPQPSFMVGYDASSEIN